MLDKTTPAEEQQSVSLSIQRPHSSSDKVRDILALVTVIGFTVISAILVIVFPLAGLAPPEAMIEILKDVSSIYSGIVGLIIGFYFGKP